MADLTDEMVDDIIIPAMKMDAKYETYLLGTAFARPVIGKKLLRGMTVLENRDAKWADIFQNAMFIGMISAFLGYVFCDFSRLWTPGDYAATSGLVPVCVMAVSAAIMVVCGLLMKKFKWSWVNDYALPISLVLGMASAIPLTAWLG